MSTQQVWTWKDFGLEIIQTILFQNLGLVDLWPVFVLSTSAFSNSQAMFLKLPYHSLQEVSGGLMPFSNIMIGKSWLKTNVGSFHLWPLTLDLWHYQWHISNSTVHGQAPTHHLWTWLDIQFRSLQHIFLKLVVQFDLRPIYDLWPIFDLWWRGNEEIERHGYSLIDNKAVESPVAVIPCLYPTVHAKPGFIMSVWSFTFHSGHLAEEMSQLYSPFNYE